MSNSFASLKQFHSTYTHLDSAELYRSLGWDDAVNTPGSQNPSAVRMHLALMDAGLSIPGSFPVLGGPHEGVDIEVSQNRLAERISSSGRFGKALVFTSGASKKEGGYKQVAGSTGIVSFQSMPGHSGGYIDLLDARSEWNCLRQCHFNAGEIRFWKIG